MPCPIAIELARALDRLHAAQMRAARAAKTPSDKREADRMLILAHKAFNAAKAAYENSRRMEAAQ